jgi:hypothetical protein
MRKYLLLTLFCSTLWATNQLSVQNPGQYGSKQGYIDEATLVIEPHGAYVEQSLYLKYSDHFNFPGQSKLEIVHRFEMPAGAVVNDMWLWIGDSVMQAICMDTWSARKIYENVVQVKRDPAFLSKNGDQYELHVFPLASGSFRKVKINFITPTRWLGEEAQAILPVNMLRVNQGLPLPLTIMFRERNYIWSDPALLETNIPFKVLKDTLGYHYKRGVVDNAQSFSQLTLKFGVQFPDGFYYSSCRAKDQTEYFQFGFIPQRFFSMTQDTAHQDYLIGLDLDPPLSENLDQTLTKLEATLRKKITSHDRFRLQVTGAGQFYEPGAIWQSVSGLASSMQKVKVSPIVQSLQNRRAPHILYADALAMQCWSFPGMEFMATREIASDVTSARYRFKYADAVAAYEHGNERVLSSQQLPMVTASLDSFFNRGGRLVSFYDYNRVGKEKLASYYIAGLSTHAKMSGTLFRASTGNIGAEFPPSFYHPVANALDYTDPLVKVELTNSQGQPVVISKKIGKGLLVVSGLWSFTDDAALRGQLAVALLGLTGRQPDQLDQLLQNMARVHRGSPYQQALVFSYSDSLLELSAAKTQVSKILSHFDAAPPRIHTITMLDGAVYTPAKVVELGTAYYGCGFWLKLLSDATGGMHFERHIYDWDYIASTLAGGTTLINGREISSTIRVDQGAGSVVEKRTVAASGSAEQPIFIIGSAQGRQSIQFDIGLSSGIPGFMQNRTINLPLQTDTTHSDVVLPSTLANELLLEKLAAAARDTAAIVKLAKQFNLLCDYTALIALEPNDTLHYMHNPFDESKYPLTPVEQKTAAADSFSLTVFPNPFNEQTSLEINLVTLSEVEIAVYNVRGQTVRHLLHATPVQGKRRFVWDGRDDLGRQASTGLYFVRMTLNNKSATRQFVKRVMMVR